MNDRWIMKDILTTAVCIAVFSIAGMGIYWKFEKWLTTPERIARPVPAAEVTPTPLLLEKTPTGIDWGTDFMNLSIQDAGASVLTVRGCPTVGHVGFARPEKAESVKIELWTSDGRKWVAKWEESK